MKYVTLGLLMGSLVLGGMVIPVEAGGRPRGHHGYDHAHHVRRHVRPVFPSVHHHGHFAGGFLAGAATVLAVEALYTPRLVVEPVYYRAPVCRHDWVPGRWEIQTQTQQGLTSYYQVWVDGHWQRHCY